MAPAPPLILFPPPQPPDCCQPGLRQCLLPGECVNGGCRGVGWSPHFEMHFVYRARDAEGDDACGLGAVLCSGSVATNTDADTGPRRCARLCAIFAECAATMYRGSLGTIHSRTLLGASR